jgi:hypothetical protein
MGRNVLSLRKLAVIEVIVILGTLLTVLTLALIGQSIENQSGHLEINGSYNNYVTIKLHKGQTVNGSVYCSGSSNGAWFGVIDPQDNAVITNIEYSGTGTFKFTAEMDGAYRLDIIWNKNWNTRASYVYSVTSFDPVPYILIVTSIGTTIAFSMVLLHLRHRKTANLNQ